MKLVDQTNHPINSSNGNLRIVSIVPSQTELLYYLGLGEKVVGVTKFCVHPSNWFKTKDRIGGTKTIDIEKVKALKPSIIFANKEENTREDIEILRQHFQVYTSDIKSLEDSYQMINDIGLITFTKKRSELLIKTLKSDFSSLSKLRGTVLYLIWYNPYMSAGTSTFINCMLSLIGLKNADQSNLRYDEINEAKIIELSPDYIFLSSEPFPFKDKHAKALRQFSRAKIIRVDGELFSWYGSRLLGFKKYYEISLLPQLK